MIANQRVIEAVSRLTGVPVAELKQSSAPTLSLPYSMDSLDWAELVIELEGEFDKETVHWAMRYIEMLAADHVTRDAASRWLVDIDPLWDPEIDG